MREILKFALSLFVGMLIILYLALAKPHCLKTKETIIHHKQTTHTVKDALTGFPKIITQPAFDEKREICIEKSDWDFKIGYRIYKSLIK